MSFYRKHLKHLLTSLAITSCLLTGVANHSFAQGSSGLTLFSGVERENILRYYLDFGGNSYGWDRYRLRISPKQMLTSVAKFYVRYPDYYDGKFDDKKMEVRIGKKKTSVPLKEVIWDQENHVIELTLEKPVDAGEKVEIVLSNVKNPDMGTFYFNCEVLPPDDTGVRYYLGTWIVSIGH